MLRTQEIDWQKRVKIWEGLQDFKSLLLELYKFDLKTINQVTLDSVLPAFSLTLMPNTREQLLLAIDKELEKLEQGSESYQNLLNERKLVEAYENELALMKQTENFTYEFAFRDLDKKKNTCGFVKIRSKEDAHYRALLSWQDEKDPILFLAEIEKEKIYFHVNLGGANGIAIIDELPEYYRWTHALASTYAELVAAEYGSAVMVRKDRSFHLEHGNIAAATALSKAQKEAEPGKSMLENNIELMKMYENDLKQVEF